MPYQVNPMELIQRIRQGENPQQLMMGILEQGAAVNNPIYANLLQMAKDGRTHEIEAFARNVAREKGIDFDKEFSKFKKQYFGL
jgi:hypothetical protein